MSEIGTRFVSEPGGALAILFSQSRQAERSAFLFLKVVRSLVRSLARNVARNVARNAASVSTFSAFFFFWDYIFELQGSKL